MLQVWRQAIIRTNEGLLLITLLRTNLSDILIKIQQCSLKKKLNLKMLAAKLQPFCLRPHGLTLTLKALWLQHILWDVWSEGNCGLWPVESPLMPLARGVTWNVPNYWPNFTRHSYLGPLLLTRIYFNFSMDKWSNAQLSVGWNNTQTSTAALLKFGNGEVISSNIL